MANSSLANKKFDQIVAHYDIAILGTGFSGLGMAIKLKQKGYNDFTVLERNTDVGGTWFVNNYPGCACDVPSHLYSFSFAPNPTWSRTFSPQNEIQNYLRNCAEKYEVIDHIKFETNVEDASWEQDHWEIKTNKGTYSSRVLVAGTGALSEPLTPDIPGIESFEGPIFHSAEWRHDLDLSGKIIASIGTGASAIQYVPEIQKDVAQLDVYMRTPPWIMPHPDRGVSEIERKIYEILPPLQLAMRAGIFWARETFALAFTSQRWLMGIGEKISSRHLRNQVKDPTLRDALTPTFKMGCKRVLLSNKFYPTLQKENVTLVNSGISSVTKNGVVTKDGIEHKADVIIFGTGFKVAEMPAASRIRGKSGVYLSTAWKGSPRALLGTTVPDFPNLFLLMGPNTGLGHNSMVYMIESQIHYTIEALKEMQKGNFDTIEAKHESLDKFVSKVDSKMEGTVWLSGCNSWYLDENGRNPSLWPGFSWQFRSAARKLENNQYIFS